jgi:hypothetical protein
MRIKKIHTSKEKLCSAESFETIFGFPHYFSSRWTPVPVPLQIWRHGE